MAITVREQRKQDWTIGAYGTAERRYKIFGTADIATAKTELLAVADASWVGLFRNDTKIRIGEAGFRAWEAIVPYSPFDLTGGGTPPTVFSFRTTGASQKIQQTGAGTVTAYPASGFSVASTDCGGGINANNSGGFDGVDAVAKAFDFELESYLPESSVNDAYLATLVSLTACTNMAVFRGFAVGEVLYLGAQGTQERGGNYRIQHAFKVSPNKSNVSVAMGQITVSSKPGWSYIWVQYVPNGVSGRKTFKAKAAYVHKLYEPGNFALLGV